MSTDILDNIKPYLFNATNTGLNWMPITDGNNGWIWKPYKEKTYSEQLLFENNSSMSVGNHYDLATSITYFDAIVVVGSSDYESTYGISATTIPITIIKQTPSRCVCVNILEQRGVSFIFDESYNAFTVTYILGSNNPKITKIYGIKY